MEKSTCSDPECDRKVVSRGMCSKHYQRAKCRGDLIPFGVYPPDMTTDEPCVIDGCAKFARKGRQGMCSKHATRAYKTGTTDDPERPQQNGVLPCSVDGCGKVSKAGGRTGVLLCAMHYSRLKRYGDVNASGMTRICVICGSAFYKRARQVTCSPECSRARLLEYGREYQEQWRAENPKPPVETYPARCIWCHQEFQATRRQFRYCSRDCQQIHRNRYEDPYSSRRAERMRSARVESFGREEILDRDGWVCWLCLESIDREAVFPDAYSSSLDHVIPLSKGGEHSRANVRAAHLTCNVRKGSKVAAIRT